jgi:hypothetical protein
VTLLLGALAASILVIGAAAFTGHPLYLIIVGLVAGAAVLVATRRANGLRPVFRWARRSR